MIDRRFRTVVEQVTDGGFDVETWLVHNERLGIRDPFGLLPAERLAIRIYTAFEPWGSAINDALWSDSDASPELVAFVSVLSAGLGKLPRVRAQVFRGAPLHGDRETFLARYEAARVVRWMGFSSASREANRAFHDSVLFRIGSLAGRSTQGYAADDGELEVIFLPATRFLVVDCREIARARFVVDLEELQD